MKPNNFQPLVQIYISQNLTEKLPRNYKCLACYHVPKPHSNRESGGITAVALFNPNATCVPFKGQGHASTVGLLRGCPETEAFR